MVWIFLCTLVCYKAIPNQICKNSPAVLLIFRNFVRPWSWLTNEEIKLYLKASTVQQAEDFFEFEKADVGGQ